MRWGPTQLPIQIFSKSHNSSEQSRTKSQVRVLFLSTEKQWPFSDFSPNVSLHTVHSNPAENRLVSALIRYLPLWVCVAAQRSHWVHGDLTAPFRTKTLALSWKTYMQIATMTTFPGPCINVVLLPDRGFGEGKKRRKPLFKSHTVFGMYAITSEISLSLTFNKILWLR